MSRFGKSRLHLPPDIARERNEQLQQNKDTYDAIQKAAGLTGPFGLLTSSLFAVAMEQASVRDILRAYTCAVLSIAVEDRAFASRWADALGESMVDFEPGKVRPLIERIKLLAARQEEAP